MARITSEDCLDYIPNHFDLVLVASKRARNILQKQPVLLDNSYIKQRPEKAAVLALREIAQGSIPVSNIQEYLDQEKEALAKQEAEQNNSMQNQAMPTPTPALSELSATTHAPGEFISIFEVPTPTATKTPSSKEGESPSDASDRPTSES